MCVYLPQFALAKIGVMDKGHVKEKLISAFWKGKSKTELETIANRYLEYAKSTGLFRPRALEQLNIDAELGDVYLVSASVDIWLETICKYLNINLICTKSIFKNEVFTGKFATPNCNYGEKPIRVNAELSLEDYNHITYYGDSAGDLAMKPLVDDFLLNPFQ